jgi:hypothetical protein
VTVRAAIWTSFGNVIVVFAGTFLLTPFVVTVIARRRQRAGALRGWAWRTAVADVGMVIGTLVPVWMILTPNDGPSRIVTPLGGLREDLAGGPVAAIVQIGGNLLVFAAFGLFGPLRWRIGTREVVVLAVAASTLLETAQYVLDLGRVTDLVDVALNATGAGLAALWVHRWWLRRLAGDRDRRAEDGDPPGGRTATTASHRSGERRA